MCKRGGENGGRGRGREGVENVVKAGSGFRIFPFASKDDLV